MKKSKKIKTKKKISLSEPASLPKISFKLGEHIYERVERHIRSLKFQEKKDIKKKEWFAAAIREKLVNERKQSKLEQIPQRKHILFPIEKDLYNDLQKHLSLIKKHCPYSTKELILEAILEKLEREESGTKEFVAKMDDL